MKQDWKAMGRSGPVTEYDNESEFYSKDDSGVVWWNLQQEQAEPEGDWLHLKKLFLFSKMLLLLTYLLNTTYYKTNVFKNFI